MKLVFVSDNGFSVENGRYYYSGANVQHYATVTKNFEDITFIARNKPYDQSGNLISEKYQVHLVDSITDGKNVIKSYKRLDSILDDAVKKSDIVMCFGINGYLAYKKAKKYNKPTIAYVGGCVFDILKNMDSKLKRISAPFIMLLIKEMVKNATYAHYVDQYLLERYPTKGKYLICPSAKIEINQTAIIKRQKKIENHSGTITIGLIGYTHNKIKGIDTAIKALQILGDGYKLQVVGRGNHNWLIELAKSLGVENQVEFLGILPSRREVFKWLDEIDVYIQPSLTEGMPRATIEAMSRGCPVVSTNAGGLVTLIDKNFRIMTNDYKGLASKIKILGKDNSIKLIEAKGNFETSKRFNFSILDQKRQEFYKIVKDTMRKSHRLDVK
ncbi:glycosyltransferase family 4 protein [Psychrobacillus sp. INOP01]|uniref:glycosyltransferase n=1 Tax=Psychrobacillus sp. INOP01 TaxID=2829187 RepID=UPI001BAE4E20|nr:glycosyltransferase [Psychrobacillus sp. INOP01]QUG40593.1 glycosyltransferase family 4 protein [Psychrobacillus sp. INOP01]